MPTCRGGSTSRRSNSFRISDVTLYQALHETKALAKGPLSDETPQNKDEKAR